MPLPLLFPRRRELAMDAAGHLQCFPRADPPSSIPLPSPGATAVVFRPEMPLPTCPCVFSVHWTSADVVGWVALRQRRSWPTVLQVLQLLREQAHAIFLNEIKNFAICEG